jgi:hypothetical protein
MYSWPTCSDWNVYRWERSYSPVKMLARLAEQMGDVTSAVLK